MDKMSAENIELLQNIVKTAALAGINNVVISDQLIKGIDDNKNVVIISDLPKKIKLDDIGLGRISVLQNRFSMLSEDSKFEVQFDTKVNGNATEFIKTLSMKGGGMKLDYQCQNPHTINAPKQIKDTFNHTIDINDEDINTIFRGCKAMGSTSDEMSLSFDGKVLKCNISDVSGDMFEFKTNAKVTGTSKFEFKYNVGKILPLLKAADAEKGVKTIEIGTKGIVKLSLNGLNLYITPLINV